MGRGERVNISIREERTCDLQGIHDLIVAAFREVAHSDHREQQIVPALRDAGALTHSLVAASSGELVGHVALSPVTISDGSTGWYGLGPIAVRPDWQGRGIGSQLMQAALSALTERAASGCVLLGDPGYYQRFGFEAHESLVLPGVPPEYFLTRVLHGVLPEGTHTVTYHPAFSVGV